MSTNLAMLTMDTLPGLVHRSGLFWFVLALLHIAQLQPALSGEEVVVRADYEYFVPEFERLVGLHGKLRVMFDMPGFHGWTAGALWEDTKFAVHHFSDIDRLAVVGEKKWQEGMATFCKPFTKATVKYFDHTAATEARKWLGEA